MAGHSHDRAGSVFHQHVVGNPHRHFFAGRRVYRVRAGEDPRFFRGGLSRDEIPPRRTLQVLVDSPALGRCGQLVHQRMLGRYHQVGRAKNRVGTSREHTHFFSSGDERNGKHDLGAVRPSDPVPLRGLGALRPVEVVEIVEQTPGIIADPEEPLLEQPLLNGRVAAFAPAANDLLVGEHGLAARTPVHRRPLFVRQFLLQELQENPLRPFVVIGVGGRENVTPVHHDSGPLDLPLEVGNVRGDQGGRMRPYLEGVVLRVNPESVIAKRLKDIVSLEPLKSSIYVTANEGEKVAHVEPFGRRIREHHQGVVRVGSTGDVDGVGLPLAPPVLPFPFYSLGIVVVCPLVAGVDGIHVHSNKVARL